MSAPEVLARVQQLFFEARGDELSTHGRQPMGGVCGGPALRLINTGLSLLVLV